MPDPWDVLPPTRGDNTIQETHAAKGEAIGEWERLEVRLRHLLGAFMGLQPGSPEARQRYGEPMNFKDRLAILECEADRYFIAECCQSLEGEFARLVRSIRGFQIRRNEVTHSHVIPIEYDREYVETTDGIGFKAHYRFFLLPPDYTDRKFLPNNQPAFRWTSREVLYFSSQFGLLGSKAEIMASAIMLPAHASYFYTLLQQLYELNTEGPPTTP